tara:strand:- start:195 stop:365 length:171 start_codon:yes stop_codon:yes gene_type:complete
VEQAERGPESLKRGFKKVQAERPARYRCDSQKYDSLDKTIRQLTLAKEGIKFPIKK